MTDDWIEYRRLILNELELLRSSNERLAEKCESLSNKITALEVRASIGGAISGAIVLIAAKLLKVIGVM